MEKGVFYILTSTFYPQYVCQHYKIYTIWIKLELDSIKPPRARVYQIILSQMKSMHWIQWMVDASGEWKATPVQSVEPEQW